MQTFKDSKTVKMSEESDIDMMRDGHDDHEAATSKINRKPVTQAKYKFKNHLVESASDPTPVDFAEIADLSQFRIERGKAMDWAMRELKLLVYDNTDVKMSGYDSDDEDGMLAMAHKMSCGVDDVVEFLKVSSFSKVRNRHSQACHVCSS